MPESQAPPVHALVMPRVAASQGVAVEVVDSGAGSEFVRPEQATAPRGPLANALAGRLTGSSAAVDAAGEAVAA